MMEGLLNDHSDLAAFSSVTYKSILDQIQDGVFIVDTGMRIVYWNRGAEQILGFARAEMVDQLCEETENLCRDAEDTSPPCFDGRCPLKRALDGKFSGRYPHPIFMRARSGTEVPVSITVCPLNDGSGKAIGAICVFRDVREEYRQLLLAGEIQKRMVTTERFESGGLVVEPLFKPLEMTGGDYIEAFITDTGLLVACMADVTGHGISAALFAMIFKTLFHASLKESYSPGKMLELINRGFCQTSTVEGYYLTASVIVFDPERRSGFFASASHPPTLVFSRNGGAEYGLKETLEAHSFMIGIVEGARYGDVPFLLEEGDFLLMATDGLYESEDARGHRLGTEGVTAYFEETGAEAPLSRLYDMARSRNPYREMRDDISMLRLTVTARET
jgi:phosphoserine phosphatase RsbU/P